MKTIYSLKVAIPNAPLELQRTFWFESEKERAIAKRMIEEMVEPNLPGLKITGHGIEHLMLPAEAVGEILREAKPESLSTTRVEPVARYHREGE
jgi:hypothetical protein